MSLAAAIHRAAMPRAGSALGPNGGTRLWRRRRAWVIRRDRAQCVLCGGRGSREHSLEVDHIRPRHLGGLDVASNLRTLCHGCHAQEQAFTLTP